MMNISIPYFLVNGVETEWVSVQDRGFTYGDGVFETCLFRNGKIALWDYHQARLLESAARLKFPVDCIFLNAQLEKLFKQLVASNVEQATIKILLTRGVGGRGYLPPEQPVPTLVISVFEAPNYPVQNQISGVSVKVCNTRLSRNQSLAGLKHLNRLEQVLARSEWKTEFAEGICLDTDSNVVEGVFSNLFLVSKENQLVSPDLSYSGVMGVMRKKVIELVKEKAMFDVLVKPVGLDELFAAEEIFLTNSLYGIWPVQRVETEGKTLEWRSFDLTHKIQAALAEALN